MLSKVGWLGAKHANPVSSIQIRSKVFNPEQSRMIRSKVGQSNQCNSASRIKLNSHADDIIIHVFPCSYTVS